MPSKRRILTVIPDYRLYPHVTFPGPVEDVRDAIAWFLVNASTVASATPFAVIRSEQWKPSETARGCPGVLWKFVPSAAFVASRHGSPAGRPCQQLASLRRA